MATPEALKLILSYPFPGNVRELENMVERCTVLGEPLLDCDALPPQILSCTRRAEAHHAGADIPTDGMDLETYLDAIEKRYLTMALERCHGVKKRAAELLGLTFRSFRYRLAKFGMDDE